MSTVINSDASLYEDSSLAPRQRVSPLAAIAQFTQSILLKPKGPWGGVDGSFNKSKLVFETADKVVLENMKVTGALDLAMHERYQKRLNSIEISERGYVRARRLKQYRETLAFSRDYKNDVAAFTTFVSGTTMQVSRWKAEMARKDLQDKSDRLNRPIQESDEFYTRHKPVVESVVQWIETVTPETPIFMMWGGANAGKTRLINQFFHRCSRKYGRTGFPQIIASHTFDDKKDDIKQHFIPKLFLQMKELFNELSNVQQQVSDYNAASQDSDGTISKSFTYMMDQTYEYLQRSGETRAVVIALDGIDRCGKEMGPQLIDALHECSKKYPVCFLLTSKYCMWVRERLFRDDIKGRVEEGRMHGFCPWDQ